MINEFTFWNVGHGLFYTGCIGDCKLNFLYDCGSSGNDRIKKCISDGKFPNIFDFAVISHLHKDHINGIDMFMEKHSVCEYLFPYIGSDLIRDLIIANIVLCKGETEEVSLNIFDKYISLSKHSDN